MQLTSESFSTESPIPGEFASAVIDPVNHIAVSTNRNPQLAWSDVPQGTRSFTLICHDYDVPSSIEDVNQEDREISESLPRVDFFHWLLLDVPKSTREIAAGSHSNGVAPRDKPGPATPEWLRHGINDYTKRFSGDSQMQGQYYGYDGPASPWNDSIVHHYVFTLCALDIPRLSVQGELTASNVKAALAGHCARRRHPVGYLFAEPAPEKAEINGTKRAGVPIF
jgi:Raf kinase inhibitor-like YbhB/YbcL family protein